MPGFDGTGPAGMGSMTGRGMGYCIMPFSKNRLNYYGYYGQASGPRIGPAAAYIPYYGQGKAFSRLNIGRMRGRRFKKGR